MTVFDQKAENLLEEFGLLEKRTNLKLLCKKLDIAVHAHNFEGCEGVLLVTHDQQRILINSGKAPTRNRYTIAHELGHYTLHVPLDGSRLFNCSSSDVGADSYVSKNEENEANKFASSLLMPKSIFSNGPGFKVPSWELINRLANTHEVSIVAAATRYIDLTTESMWLIVVNSGHIQRFVKPTFVETLPTVGHKFMTRKTTEWVEISAEHIFYGNNWTRGKSVFVSSLGQNDYGENLILVWDKGHSLMNYGDSYQGSDYEDEDDFYERNSRGSYRWKDR